jgi:hypothetical protein
MNAREMNGSLIRYLPKRKVLSVKKNNIKKPDLPSQQNEGTTVKRNAVALAAQILVIVFYLSTLYPYSLHTFLLPLSRQV